MAKKEVPQLRNHQPIAQVMKKAYAKAMYPLQNQSKDSGEDLWSHRQAEAQRLELVDMTL